MAKKWTKLENEYYSKELKNLYLRQNKSIVEISKIIDLSESGVYGRLVNCGIATRRNLKARYNNQREVKIPSYSIQLAEFIGVLLGDGCINYYQVIVTLGTKERPYGNHISKLIFKIFRIKPKIIYRQQKYLTIYFGSRKIVEWLLQMGLAFNKVEAQVRIPDWCFTSTEYMNAVIRGLIDTDGSIYRLRNGLQISFTNKSLPLLKDTRYMLIYLGYSPSRVSCNKIYLTKKADILRYRLEIGFKNEKHLKRLAAFVDK